MSKSLYEMFETDAALETDGLALEYGKATIIVARAGGANRKFQSVLESKLRPYRAQLRVGAMDDDVALRLLAEAYADGVIIAWDGVKDRDGNALEFTKPNVVKLLLDLPDLFVDIQQQSQLMTNFIAESRDEDAKS